MIYLACPYSHPSHSVRHARFLAANRAAAVLIKEGHTVFSPISHSHPIADTGIIDTHWGGWYAQDNEFVRLSSAVYVLMIDGWDKSPGVKAEVELAQLLGMPVQYGKWGMENVVEELPYGENWDKANF